MSCIGADPGFCFTSCLSDFECPQEPARQVCREICGGMYMACVESPPKQCGDDVDCDSHEICADAARTCVTGCRNHEACRPEEFCDPGALTCKAGCRDDAGCTKPETCIEGVCVDQTQACEDHKDCYDLVSHHCSRWPKPKTEEHYCEDIACGSARNGCSACTEGPNEGQPDPDGPIIFPTSTAAICMTTHNCRASDFAQSCKYTFQVFDPNGDLSTDDFGLSYVLLAGQRDVVTKRAVVKDGDGYSLLLRDCVLIGSQPEVAFYVRNQSGKASNTLCFGKDDPCKRPPGCFPSD